MIAGSLSGFIELIREELHAINPDLSETLPADELLRDELGVDSLDLVELVASLEYQFGVLVPEDDWVKLGTIEQIAEYMTSRVRADG